MINTLFELISCIFHTSEYKRWRYFLGFNLQLDIITTSEHNYPITGGETLIECNQILAIVSDIEQKQQFPLCDFHLCSLRHLKYRPCHHLEMLLVK